MVVTTTEEYEVQQEVAAFREHPEQLVSGADVRTVKFNVPAFIIAQDLNPHADAPVWTLPEQPAWPTVDLDAPAAEGRGRHWDNRIHRHRDAVPAWFAEFTHAHTALLSSVATALVVLGLVALGLKLVLVFGFVALFSVVCLAAALERPDSRETLLDGLLRRVNRMGGAR